MENAATKPPFALRIRARGTLVAVLLASWLGNAFAPTSGAHGHELATASAPPNARALAGMEPALERRLAEAFELANRTVERVESCRELFRGLDRPAAQSLTATFYVQASGRLEQRICRRGVSAFTEVGSRVTYLCRDFRRLPTSRAAAALVHEALHLAGLEEAPARSSALSSAEINQRVASACRL